MNANELAEIMMVFDSSQVWEHAEEIATMLRQLQAENEALKAELRGIDELIIGKAQEK